MFPRFFFFIQNKKKILFFFFFTPHRRGRHAKALHPPNRGIEHLFRLSNALSSAKTDKLNLRCHILNRLNISLQLHRLQIC